MNDMTELLDEELQLLKTLSTNAKKLFLKPLSKFYI